jgi:thiamine biosynthesis lipoprotein
MSLSYNGGNDSGIKALADDLNAKINPDISTSEVAIFNAMQEGEIEVSKCVFDLVSLSLEIYEKSGGAFDITLSDLSKLWSVDHKSLEDYANSEFPPLPDYEELASYTSGMEDISIREQDGKYYLSKSKASVKIDLGGIAKGYLSDLVAEKLRTNGTKSAIIDVTGNLYLLGKKINSDGSLLDWRIGVNNCFEAGGEYLCGIICPQNTAVVTSGTYERYYKKNEIKINHIINPFTGMPVGVAYNGEYSNTSNHVVSATVIGSNGAVCDALATAVCVLGMESGASLIQSEGLSALIVTADGKYTTVGTVDFMAGDFLINGMEKV